MTISLLCVLSLLNIVIVTIADNPTVKISQGTIYGTLSSDGSIEKFQGIPYAEPPTGKKRYKAPVTPAKWSGTFYANRTNIQCPQMNSGGVAGTEDCLILNVYRPKPSNGTAKALSVMVYIHGGALVSGASGPYDSDFLMKRGVILVTVNYRLGSLGFLCYKTEDIPGNAGLKDQRAALRWVKENIYAFGGDTNSITIFGESAGALSVDLQVLSDSTKGILFNRAIAESGSALAEWAIDRKPFDRVNTVAKMLGANTSDKTKLTEFYQNVDYVKLIQTSAEYDSSTNTLVPSYVCIEKSSITTEPFLTDFPANIIQSDCRHQVDMITGFNNAEGILPLLFRNPEDVYNKLVQNFTKSLPRDLCFDCNKTQDRVAKIVKQFYFGDSSYSNDSVVPMIDYYTDILFMISTVRAQEARINHSNITSFLYEFCWEGQRNLKYIFGSTLPGASHGDEVAFLFPLEVLPFAKPPNANDQIMIDRMTAMWTNFAKVGNPTPEVTSLLPVKWTPVSSDALNTFIIDMNMTTQIRPLQQRIAFWDIIYDNYGCEKRNCDSSADHGAIDLLLNNPLIQL